MKKLISLVVVALFATATFAQDAKPEQKPEMKAATEMKSASDVKAVPKMKHECYWMKDGELIHCMGEKSEPMKTSVTLKNGTTLSPKGEVKMKDGVPMKLENGQCVSMMGSIGDCEKMHASTPAEKPTEYK